MQDVIQSEPELLQQLTQNGAGYFNICGYVTFVKHDDKIYYLACPNDDCRRKVTENDGMVDRTGKYRCDHCNKSYDHCNPSYMLLAKISDFSDSVFVNFYRQQAETIMNGVSADQVK
jgi:replication factor A1